MDLFNEQVLTFAQNAGSQAVLVLMVFYQWYLIREQGKSEKLLIQTHHESTIDLIKVNQEQNLVLKQLEERIKDLYNKL